VSRGGEAFVATLMLQDDHPSGAPARARADAEAHRSSRPCPVCDAPMSAGRCRAHGAPAEDGGDWLWGGAS
jgi:hypothetical protein